MNTVVTIPWDAVVNDRRSSRARALPLTVAEHCRCRTAAPEPDAVAAAFADEPLAVVGRQPSSRSALVELVLASHARTVVLTSDGASGVVIQASWANAGTWDIPDPSLRRAAVVRAVVGRHARFDPDARAFVLTPAAEADPSKSPLEFLRPAAWGFESMPGGGHHWSPDELFQTDRTPSPMPRPLNPPYRQRFEDLSDLPAPTDRGDPFRCLAQLLQIRDTFDRSAGQVAATPGPASQVLPRLLALALGRCRLFGVRIPAASDFTLTPSTFDRAARGVLGFLAVATRRAMAVEHELATAGGYCQRNAAMELLEARTDAHAAYLALDEAYAAARFEGHPAADKMGRTLHQVRRLINLFDGNLQKNTPLLRLAASTFLLENWRRLLAPIHRELPPWWLDGCLEA